MIGEPPAKLFTAVGQGHAFDDGFFVGDLGLEVVEKAWFALDQAIEKRVREMETEKDVGLGSGS
jgi:hypothetical protein